MKPPLSLSKLSPPPSSGTQGACSVAQWRSKDLFGQAKEIVITHEGKSYHLRITSNNKLILTA